MLNPRARAPQASLSVSRVSQHRRVIATLSASYRTTLVGFWLPFVHRNFHFLYKTLDPSVAVPRHTFGRTMATSRLQIKLTEEATRALQPLGKWLAEAPFWALENESYEICRDTDGLVSNAREFIACFSPTIKVQHLRICYNPHIRLMLFL